MEIQKLASISEKKGNQSPLNPFLDIMYQLLEKNEYEQIFSWDKNGTAILVKDTDAFEKVVLKNHFGHQKISSFTRQLNMYHFKKTRRDSTSYEYSNPYFVRGNLNLIKQITRRQVSRKKNTEISKEDTQTSSNYEEEPQLVKKFKEDHFYFETEDSGDLRDTMQKLQTEKDAIGNDIRELHSEIKELRTYVIQVHSFNKKLSTMLNFQNDKIRLLEQQLGRIDNQVRWNTSMNNIEQPTRIMSDYEYNIGSRGQSTSQPLFNENRDFLGMREDFSNAYN